MLYKELKQTTMIGQFRLIVPSDIVIFEMDEIRITKMVNTLTCVYIYIDLDNPFRNIEQESDCSSCEESDADESVEGASSSLTTPSLLNESDDEPTPERDECNSISHQEIFSIIYSIMGCRPSALRTNLSTDEPHQVTSSTTLRADQIVVLGDSVYLPTAQNGSPAIIEIKVEDKKIHVYRGFKNDLIRSGLS